LAACCCIWWAAPTPRILHRSDCICSALQLVNFWQDIAIDWQKERVYLPQADLERFGIDGEAQIAAGCWSAEWAALLDFETERTRRLMLQAPRWSINCPAAWAGKSA
jgi:phytoene/squalene synthetase